MPSYNQLLARAQQFLMRRPKRRSRTLLKQVLALRARVDALVGMGLLCNAHRCAEAVEHFNRPSPFSPTRSSPMPTSAALLPSPRAFRRGRARISSNTSPTSPIRRSCSTTSAPRSDPSAATKLSTHSAAPRSSSPITPKRFSTSPMFCRTSNNFPKPSPPTAGGKSAPRISRPATTSATRCAAGKAR